MTPVVGPIPSLPVLFAQEPFIKTTLLFLTFLLYAIPFYHGTTLAFAIHLLVGKGLKPAEPVFHFAFSLAEGTVFYAMSLQMASLQTFVAWLAVLVSVDLLWVSISLKLRRKGLGLRRAEEAKPPLDWWLILDIYGLIFPVYFFLHFQPTDVLTYFVLFLASLFRTVVDYYTGWKFYFPCFGK